MKVMKSHEKKFELEHPHKLMLSHKFVQIIVISNFSQVHIYC